MNQDHKADPDLCSNCDFKGTSAIPEYVPSKSCKQCGILLGGIEIKNGSLVVHFEGKGII